MTTSAEAQNAEMLQELRNLTQAYVKLEVTTRTEMKGLREDVVDLRESLRDVTRTHADHSGRLTAGETRIMALQDDRVAVADLRTRLSVLEAKVEHNAPQKAPWTAITSAVVAVGALAWTFFGK